MPCYNPVMAWSKGKKSNGKCHIVFKCPNTPSKKYEYLQLSCGKCLGCVLERARQWSVRCVHESKMHDFSSFITLTYDPKFLPEYGSLVKNHFTLFMKRLRQAVLPVKIRFFMCGEYGSEGSRPHYHALIFGYSFPDRVLLSEKDGVRLYRSPMLERLWEYGFSTVGDITERSAQYVARYAVKKVISDVPEMDADEFCGMIPEYVCMSRGNGIGNSWFLKYEQDVFPCDNVVVRGKAGRPPNYYDKLLDKAQPEVYNEIKVKRKAKALEVKDDNTFERLKVKEAVKRSQIELLKRGLK